MVNNERSEAIASLPVVVGAGDVQDTQGNFRGNEAPELADGGSLRTQTTGRQKRDVV